jgi:sugar lactone lactonase YvrE
MKHHLLALALLVCVLTDARAASGDLFVANEAALGSGSIYQFSPSGSNSTFAMNLNQPIGLAFDSKSNLYVGDYGGNSDVVYKFAPDGSHSTFVTGFSPSGLLTLAFDKGDNLYVGDPGAKSISKISPSGDKSTFVTTPDLVPYALAFDGAGNLFVGIHGSDVIYKFTPDGAQSTFASGVSLNYFGLAFDRAGNLFAFDNSAGGPGSHPGIVKFAPDGTRTMFALCPTNDLQGIAFDSAGNLFAGDGNGSIYKFSSDGTKNTFATGMTGPYSLAFASTLPVPPPPEVSIAASGSRMTIQFAGILQQSTNLMDWADLDPQPANPWTSTPTNQYIFFRARTAGN